MRPLGSAARAWLPILLLAGQATAARAQVAWPDFVITSGGGQAYPLAADGWKGGYVVTWNRNGSGDTAWDAFGRRVSPGGALLGSEFQVNSYTTGSQFATDVAVDERGRFVVTTWDGADAFARRFDAAGTPVGLEFRVNSHLPGRQRNPKVALTPNGFVVVWVSQGQDGSGEGVFGQRFDAAGTRLGAEFAINVQTSGDQHDVSITALPDGGFVVAWTGRDADEEGVFATRFGADGTRVGDEFQVNVSTTGRQHAGSVDATGDGRFVVAWTSFAPWAVLGRLFDATGLPQGGELTLEPSQPLFFLAAEVCLDAAGNFVVAELVQHQMIPARFVAGARFSALGSGRGAWFASDSLDTVMGFALACDAAGNFLVVWDRTASQIVGRRYGGLTPAGLAIDTAGNGMLEPGETVDARPSWTNVNADAVTFGAAASFTGPAANGVTYQLPDATADYGTVAPASTAQCADCLQVGVTFTGTRPALHWDAVLDERITPDVQGQDQLWRLHLGNSFTDVPPTSLFYRFVETLLHRGATGGCGSGAFCPVDPTTRGAMAVFVLLAKEGASYAPPACTAAPFPDVPPNHPFCPFIAEVSRRGVVAGCGGGNYCPGQPVLRDQMAVFTLATLDPAFTPPPCGPTPRFPDVPPGSPFCPFVEELARRGVVSGCGGGNYCPGNPVTRQEMAVFAAAAFGLTLYGP